MSEFTSTQVVCNLSCPFCRLHLPKLVPALGPLLETIEELNARICDNERKLVEIARAFYAETGLLRQVQGVGVLSALTLVLVLWRIPTDSRRAGR